MARWREASGWGERGWQWLKPAAGLFTPAYVSPCFKPAMLLTATSQGRTSCPPESVEGLAIIIRPTEGYENLTFGVEASPHLEITIQPSVPGKSVHDGLHVVADEGLVSGK